MLELLDGELVDKLIVESELELDTDVELEDDKELDVLETSVEGLDVLELDDPDEVVTETNVELELLELEIEEVKLTKVLELVDKLVLELVKL